MTEAERIYFLDKFLLGISKRWKRMIWEPLQITFHLSSPITLNHPWMHFDGLIGHLLLLDALQDDFFLLPSKFPISRLLDGVKTPPLPIKRTGWIYHASISFFDIDRKVLEMMYKKLEDRWIGGKTKLSKGSGFFKEYAMQHIYIPATQVTFYVCGDKPVLIDLCKIVTGLGDNTRVGWGAVRAWEIKEIPEDWSVVKEGIAMRPIPEKDLEFTSEKVALAWKPPYWAAENVGICAPPGAKVVLKNG